MTDAPDVAPAARDPYRTVLEVGTTLASSLDVDEVIQTIARQVGEALDVQWCDINEYDAEARTMTYVAVWSEELRGDRLDYVGTVVSLDDRPERDAVIRKGDLLEAYVDDEDLDPLERDVMVEYDERAVMEVPLEFGGETLGVLGVVESRRDRRFTEEEKELLRLLAQAGRDGARQRAPVPAAAGAGAPPGRAARRLAGRSRSRWTSTRCWPGSRGWPRRWWAPPTPRSTSTGRTTTPSSTARSTRSSRPARRARRCAREHVRARGLPGERAILEAAEAVQEHISDAGLPRTAAGRWRSGGRRRA